MKKYSFDDLNGKVCVITGGTGVLGLLMVEALASVGVKIAMISRDETKTKLIAADIEKRTGTKVIGVYADVLEKNLLITAKEIINKELGTIDILINGAGGNSPKATTGKEYMSSEDLKDVEKSFYGMDIEGFDFVFNLNFKGTLLPTMVFSSDMVKTGKGSILNISSMNSFRPLTKIPAYSAAKAAINNFTQWLAVHFAMTGVRVNAIAPGFFLTEQNRFLLIDEKTNQFTPRANKIIEGTPMRKFGNPSDLNGAMLYLISDLSSFVTGVVLPVDGGFNAYGGV